MGGSYLLAFEPPQPGLPHPNTCRAPLPDVCGCSQQDVVWLVVPVPLLAAKGCVVWCGVSLHARAAAPARQATWSPAVSSGTGKMSLAASSCNQRHECDEPCDVLLQAAALVQQALQYPAANSSTGAMRHMASGRNRSQKSGSGATGVGGAGGLAAAVLR